MSLTQEFRSEITCIIQENYDDWLADEDNFVDLIIDTVMEIADDLGVFRGTT